MRKPRVIIFDDEITVLDMLERYLRDSGYEVYSYTEPIVCPLTEKCEESCKELDPCADVVLTDFRMPCMNGIEILERQSQRGCKLDIRNKAVLSSHMDQADHEKIKKLGCAFFQKPFTLSQLFEWLGECTKRINLSQPLSEI